MESNGGKKNTLFVLVLVLGATAIFFAYAAIGPSAPDPVRKVHGMISQTLSRFSLPEILAPEDGGGNENVKKNITNDYEDLDEPDPDPIPRSRRKQTSPNFAKKNNFSRLFPTRSVKKLNQSIVFIKELLEPYYQQIEDTVKSLNASKPWSLVWKKYQVADGYKSTYFNILKKHSIHVVHLKVEKTKLEKIFDNSFYNYASNDCDRLEDHSIYGKMMGKQLYNATCHSDLTSSLKPRPLQGAALEVSLPAFVTKLDDVTTLTFIHVIQNAHVKATGDIYVDGLKIVPQRCMQDLKGNSPDNISEVHPEVFTIAQFWGGGFFHATVEQLTRMAPYVPFLQRNPRIPIHVESRSKFLNAILTHLGLDHHRLISGNIRAKLLYAPAGSGCARSGLFNTHLMSTWYRARMRTKPQPRNSIVLVRRAPGKRRWFTHHDAILKMLKRVASGRGLRVEVFGDSPVPPLETALSMFNRAWMVIGPHGAGLSNMFFTEPGTLVLEGLCYHTGQANLCYRNLAQLLGLRWYGVLLEEQCMGIRPEHLEKPLTFYLDAFLPKRTS